MDNQFKGKIFIVLALICINNVASDLDEDPVQVKFLWQGRHWSTMDWFNAVRTDSGFIFKDILWTQTLDTISKVKIIPLLMGCGYGKDISDFLRLSTYTITDCVAWSDVDCWVRLGNIFEKAAQTVFKIVCTFVQVYRLRRIDVTEIPFYGVLLAITSFLEEQGPGVKIGLINIEALSLNERIEALAEHFDKKLNLTCRPDNSFLIRDTLEIEFRDVKNIGHKKTHLDFYLFKLNFFMENIIEHMLYIGFHYYHDKKEVRFSVPVPYAIDYLPVNSVKQKTLLNYN